MTARHFSLAVAAVALLLALGAVRDPNSSRPDGPVVRPVAAVATEPVPHADDAADDPAIWLHPTDPAKSLILGTDKKGGLIAYDLDNNKKGKQEQYELSATPDGRVTAALVRSFSIPSETEGCVADDRASCVFIAEERVGIWKFPAEPDGGDRGEVIARVGEHGLAADVEGLTLYCGPDNRGYLIASSQGNSTFKVYQRTGRHDFVCTIAPARGPRPQLDPPDHTDGITAVSRPMGRAFPRGALVVQDGKNDTGRQNFKLYRWEDVAGDLLDSTPGPDPRAPVR